MFFCLSFGEQTFTSTLPGYQGNTPIRCANCGNFSASAVKSRSWITVCFIPLIPLSIKADHDVRCRTCRFSQPLEHRPDVQQMRGGGEKPPLQGSQQEPMGPHYG